MHEAQWLGPPLMLTPCSPAENSQAELPATFTQDQLMAPNCPWGLGTISSIWQKLGPRALPRNMSNIPDPLPRH